MRRWTVIVAVVTLLTMLVQGAPALAKSGKTEKKTVAASSEKSRSASKKPASTEAKASSKTSSKQEKSASPKTNATREDSRQDKASRAKEPARDDGRTARKDTPQGRDGSKASKPDKSEAEASSKSAKGKASRGKAERARTAEVQVPLPQSFRGEFDVDTKAAMVMDMESGKVLYAQEPDTPIPPASLTKVLTLYLVNELLKDGTLKPDTAIPVSQEASHAGGSTMRLKTGEVATLDDLIKGIAIVSANDGCVAVAEYLGKGSMEPFVQAMNAKAKALGMTNSQFFNPNGLPADGQVTTARDMAILAKAYLKAFPESLAVHSMTEFIRNNRVRHNSNTLLGRVEGVDGLKTGFVCASGYNIVVTAKRGETRIVAVVLGAKNRRVREREATRLIEEGFKIVAVEKAQSGQQVAMKH